MDTIQMKAFGKVNLGLDVLRRREDGYHEVRMIMQTIQLFDRISIEKKLQEGIWLETNLPFLPVNENNIAYKAARMLMEEFQNVLLSYRLRGNPPEHQNFPGKVRYLIYQVKIIMQSFYPLMLNTAKRSRTTVEALELRGYRYAAVNKEVKKLKLSSLKVGYNDLMFLAISLLFVAVSLLVSTLI